MLHSRSPLVCALAFVGCSLTIFEMPSQLMPWPDQNRHRRRFSGRAVDGYSLPSNISGELCVTMTDSRFLFKIELRKRQFQDEHALRY